MFEYLLKSVLGIAEEFDVSYSTVAKYLRGIGRRTKTTPKVLEKMKNLRKSGLTYEEIARELDVGYSTVAKYMKEEGLGGRRKEEKRGFLDKLKKKLRLE